MLRYFPIVLGVLVIVGLTGVQSRMSDRFAGANFTAEQQAKLLEKIPIEFGDWIGEDMPIDAEARKTAGAIGAVNRTYRNPRTGERVDLWLIVGHARPISAHTPNICYPASGFTMRSPESALHMFVVEELPEAPFWTNTFVKEDLQGRQFIRVFWSWYNPLAESTDGNVHWEAPKNSRWHFGNTRAVYKMYFSSPMRDFKETTEQSPCAQFARAFLPIVDEALTSVYSPSTTAGEADSTSPASEIEVAPAAEATEPAQS